MNRSELRTRILDALNESATSPVFFSTTQVDQSIQEGMEILSEEARAVKRTAFQPLLNGTTYYHTQGIAEDMMVPYRIWLTHLKRRLRPVTFLDLDRHHENWIETTGDPEVWFSLSWDAFGIYPFPASAGGIMRVDYLAWPRTLQDDSDEPEFVLADHEAIVLYGVYDGLMKMWNFEKANEIFSLFLERLIKTQERYGVDRIDARVFQIPSNQNMGFVRGIKD